jgi:hypothetical protein
MNKHIIACAIGMAAMAHAQASVITAAVPGGTMSVDVSDTYPQTTDGQVKAVAGIPTSAGVGQASVDNGAIHLTFVNGTPTPTVLGVYAEDSTNFSPTLPRGAASITIPLTFSSQAVSTAGYTLDIYGRAGGDYRYSDGIYAIDYSFKVTATDASGQTQTVLDMVSPAQGGQDITNLSSGLLATAIIPQGFDLNSVKAQFSASFRAVVQPSMTSHLGTANGTWLVGVTDLTLRPTAAIPESGTAALMLIGLCGLAAAKRIRQRD